MERFKYIMGLLLVASLLSVGCGSKGKGGKGGTGGSGSDDDEIDVTPPTLTGSVELIPTSLDVLSQYYGWNVPDNIKVQVQISTRRYGYYERTTNAIMSLEQCLASANGCDRGFGGYVRLQYSSGSYTSPYPDTFTSLANPAAAQRADTNVENHRYNLYSADYPESQSKPAYHGFFQDGYGALILVLDSDNDQGDGQGPTTANGRVYFRNWTGNAQPLQLTLDSVYGWILQQWGPTSPTSCWFIYPTVADSTPYDCRAWKNGNAVQTKRSLYPDNDYVQLGTFINLEVKKAFNGDL